MVFMSEMLVFLKLIWCLDYAETKLIKQEGQTLTPFMEVQYMQEQTDQKSQ